MASSTVFCGTCGAQNPANHTFCFSCGHSLPTSIPGIAPGVTLTGLLPPHTLLKQRYRILHKVGKGGMGAVYVARDTQLGDRLVAVKEMSQNSLYPDEVADAVDGFKREAHLLAGLQHPNLPSIYDHFEEAKRWYLVMSFIQGQTLQDHLAQAQGGKLPVEEVLQIGIDLCTVLDYLHAYQPPIIFRDLKPANIMCTPNGHIYLIDFGIARHFKPGQAKDTANYGSAGYAPPEQYGKAQTTPRSDIYGLGATLYQLLSGYEPSTSPFRLPPLQSLAPTLPAKLVSLITQMLEMDDGRRPANMNVVKKELQEIAISLSSASTVLSAQSPVAPTIPAPQPFASKVSVLPSPQIVSSSVSVSKSVWSFGRRQLVALIAGAVLASIFDVLFYRINSPVWFSIGVLGIGLFTLCILGIAAVTFFFGAFFGPWVGLCVGTASLIVDAINGNFSFAWPYDTSIAFMAFVIGLVFLRAQRRYGKAIWMSVLAIVIGNGFAYYVDGAIHHFAIGETTQLFIGYTLFYWLLLLIVYIVHTSATRRKQTP